MNSNQQLSLLLLTIFLFVGLILVGITVLMVIRLLDSEELPLTITDPEAAEIERIKEGE